MKKPKLENISIADINARIRAFFLDSQVEEAEHISALLGCVTPSDEVAEKEYDESDVRVAKVEHLVPLMYAFASSMADGMVSHQRSHMEDDLEEDSELVSNEAWAATKNVFTKVAFNTLMGSISQLVDLGLVSISTPKKSSWLRKLTR